MEWNVRKKCRKIYKKYVSIKLLQKRTGITISTISDWNIKKSNPASEKADEESVPGAVATAFIMGATIRRINKAGVEAYSQML